MCTQTPAAEVSGRAELGRMEPHIWTPVACRRSTNFQWWFVLSASWFVSLVPVVAGTAEVSVADPKPAGAASATRSVASAALFRVEHSEGRLALVGELDVAGWSSLEQAFDAALSDSRKLVVDLSGLRFIDAHSIGLLISAASRCPLELRSPRPIVERVFDVLGVGDHPRIAVVSQRGAGL